MCKKFETATKPKGIVGDKPVANQVHAKESTYIPALYLRNEQSSKILIYFHGNAEDLILAEDQMRLIKDFCNVSVIGMEYPGYGFYQGNGEASEEKLKEDAEYLYKFLLHDMDIEQNDIIVFGRSMGGGPAAWLAGTFKPRALGLMSAYTSVCRVARDHVGWFPALFLSERFDNIN